MASPSLADRVVVTAEQMQAIETRLFAAGLPVAALMEKVANRLSQRLMAEYPDRQQRWGIWVGPGHNGGDALVVARELHLQGYPVQIWHPFERRKPLTEAHLQFAQHLGIPITNTYPDSCDRWLDGGFGFGLSRTLNEASQAAIAHLNASGKPICSIDLPSGLDTDRGEPLGAAIAAERTVCLGLWKQGLLQLAAAPWRGQLERLDFGIPEADIVAVLGSNPPRQILTDARAIAALPLPLATDAHKYRRGHLLLIVGSQRYRGAALLAAIAARASGVGMVTLAVPEHLSAIAVAQVPEALVVACPETATGEIAELPLDCDRYSAIAIGPGVGTGSSIRSVLQQVLQQARSLLIDADALTVLAQHPEDWTLRPAGSAAVITPHAGEFQRLFSSVPTPEAVDAAVAEHSVILVRKGPSPTVATPAGTSWSLVDSTPALARGGSGDVLTGLLGGLLAQTDAVSAAIAATWWHSRTAQAIARTHSPLGVSPTDLAAQLAFWLGQRLRSDSAHGYLTRE
ncbi:NAD(P)H-hydrate dehydratase [Synechococcus elongatus]|uniref:Bifunctional NAD(P)H-hydrate repair enzyme n=1 Tax=Synechococcus elongatus PCC 11802 TaxID=2283154 RepID=A0AAU6R4W8_SYNEL|nr:NAD(P)H-hydrate dehydratase [Synechococcus elongatus PCC 11802]